LIGVKDFMMLSSYYFYSYKVRWYNLVKLDSFYVAGATMHIETSSIVSWIEEVTLNAHIVKGDNFDGFNFGAGLSF